jgi:hypothetical protein
LASLIRSGAGSWTLYDSATLAAVAKPDFDSGSCANSATFEGFDGFLLGQIGDASGSGVSAVGLFGAAGPLVKLRHYALPKGARQIIVAPLY